jgi:hypothetical protein
MVVSNLRKMFSVGGLEVLRRVVVYQTGIINDYGKGVMGGCK